MRSITYSEARANLAKTMDSVSDDEEPIIITRGRSQSYVLMTLEQYETMDETAYLLRSPANAERLRRSLEAIASGGGSERQPDLDA